MNEKIYAFDITEEQLKDLPTVRLVDEAAALEGEIGRLKEKLDSMNREVAARVQFRQGGRTSHAFGRHHSARVRRRESLEWDQPSLENLRREIGDEAFFRIFRKVYEPKSARVVSSALEGGPFAAEIARAISFVSEAPQVSFERREQSLPPVFRDRLQPSLACRQ